MIRPAAGRVRKAVDRGGHPLSEPHHQLLIVGSDRATTAARDALASVGIGGRLVRDPMEAVVCHRQGSFALALIGGGVSALRLRLCAALREARRVPIVLLGAEATEREAITRNGGPDDFVVREFDTDEVVTRVRIWLRRAEDAFLQTGPPSDVELGPLRLHPDSRRVSFGPQTEQLTATEYRLLRHLAEKPERVFTREELLRAVWGYEHSGYAHTLTTHVNRLRQKIEGGLGAPRLVETVRGLGYRFTSDTAH